MKKTTRPEPTELEILSEISEKLNKVIALLSINGKEDDAKISILRSLGHDWNFIGLLTGLQPDTARMRYSSKKKTKASNLRKNLEQL